MEIRPSSTAGPAPGSAPVSHSSPAIPRTRRQKIHLACRNCRDRKTRCDGRRPVCAACERRDVASTCVYERAPLSSRRYLRPYLEPVVLLNACSDTLQIWKIDYSDSSRESRLSSSVFRVSTRLFSHSKLSVLNQSHYLLGPCD